MFAFEEETGEKWTVRYRRGTHKDRPLISKIEWDGSEQEIPLTFQQAAIYRDLAEKRGLRVKIEKI